MGGLSALASLADTAITGNYYRKVLYYRPIAYWPLWETSGTAARCLVNVAQNGTYTGVTLANAAGPDGNLCPWFDGVNDYVDIYSATLVAAFNGNEGTLMAWAKVNAVGVWADGAERRIAILRADNDNRVLAGKSNVNDTLRWAYEAGNVLELRDNAGYVNTNWFQHLITWSKSADTVQSYYNGSTVGAAMTILGIWAGALNINTVLIGAGDKTPTLVWHGWLAHCAVWNRALTPAEITALATV